ncbi:hypothetical protein GCM10009430_24350 [Aquimarina litoralis]|uniref:Uncharacterized protein n=1 Tax=Aquimarina litoralis TaxID=584605 RepID=A0ABP3U0X0_9FLAO
MGQRIHFYKNNWNNELEDLILENYSDFAEWYVKRNQASLEEFDEMYGTEQLIDFFNSNRNIETNLKELDKKLLDELVAEFVCEYSESIKVLDFFGPSMNKWKYIESTKLVSKTKDSEFITLWGYLINGRSLKNSEKFDSYTNEYKIGYLSYEEHSKLKELIIQYFGDLQGMKATYWTKSEKKKLENAIRNAKNGSYYLSNHNPVTSGLEYVMEALNEIKDIKTQLITGIE